MITSRNVNDTMAVRYLAIALIVLNKTKITKESAIEHEVIFKNSISCLYLKLMRINS